MRNARFIIGRPIGAGTEETGCSGVERTGIGGGSSDLNPDGGDGRIGDGGSEI